MHARRAEFGINDEFGVLGSRSELDGFHEDGPSLEELAIDDTLSDLQKVQRYLSADFVLHRLFTLKDIVEIARGVGISTTLAQILPMLDKLASDDEPMIRQTLLEQAPGLCSFLVGDGGEAGYERMTRGLVPLVSGLITDANPQVRGAAIDCFVALARLTRPEHMHSIALPPVLALAKDSIEEESRASATRLLNELSAVFPAPLVQTHVMPHLTELGADPMFRVRKAVAANLNFVCASQARQPEALIALYSALCNDEIWGVRKACAESLFVLAEQLDVEVRVKVLVPRFLAFADDASRWVRGAAYQVLGPFISTFANGTVPTQLVDHFCQMTNPALAKSVDSEIAAHCAYAFPAVVQTLGPAGWATLQPAFELLVKDVQWRVRKSLACSLHVLAGILGTALAEQHLLGAFELLVRDLDEVRVGVLQSLAQFVAVLSPDARVRYLALVVEIKEAAENWRFRELIADQFAGLASLYQPDVVAERLVPVLLQLCEDSVASVRDVAATAVGPVLRILADSPEPLLAFATRVRDLALGESYQTRQLYVRCCHCLLDHVEPGLVDAHFLEPLLRLKDDSVPNVRLVLAKLLRAMHQRAHFAAKPAFVEALAQLRGDSDADVAYFCAP